MSTMDYLKKNLTPPVSPNAAIRAQQEAEIAAEKARRAAEKK